MKHSIYGRMAPAMAALLLGSVVSAPLAMAESDDVVTSTRDSVKLSIGGHVNRAVMMSNDGEQTDVFHVDNDTEPTLLNFVATARVSDDWTVGARVEGQFVSNASNGVSQNDSDAAIGGTSFTERFLEVSFDSRTYGRLSLGQGATASEGISEIDLSGTNIVTRSNFGTFGGGLLFRDSDTEALTGTSIGGAFDNFDGLGRDDRVRYDSPVFAGFQASGSAVQGGALDIALRYSADFAGTKVAAGVAYANQASVSDTVDDQWSGSASAIMENGLNLTLAGGVRSQDTAGDDDPYFFYGKVGYRASLIDAGKTSFSFEGALEEGLALEDDEATMYGVGIAQRIDSIGTELYAGVRLYQLDRDNADLDDMLVSMVGAIVTF